MNFTRLNQTSLHKEGEKENRDPQLLDVCTGLIHPTYRNVWVGVFNLEQQDRAVTMSDLINLENTSTQESVCSRLYTNRFRFSVNSCFHLLKVEEIV